MVINPIKQGPKTTMLNSLHLEKVNNYKYLGSKIDDKLNYDLQWEKTASITNKHFNLFKQL
jgi:hypothetical protein